MSHQVHRHDMVDQLIMNSHPHPSDVCTLAVGVGADCKFIKAKDKGGSILYQLKGIEATVALVRNNVMVVYVRVSCLFTLVCDWPPCGRNCT